MYGSAPIFRTTNSSVFLSRPVDTCILPVHSTLQYVLVTTQKGSSAWIELGENCTLLHESKQPPYEECKMHAITVDSYDDPDLAIIMTIFNITVDDEFLNLKPEGESSIQVVFHFSATDADDENITANIHFISDEETATPVPHQTTPMPSPTVAPKLCPCSKLPDAILGTQVPNVTSASVHLSTCTWLLSLSLITSVIFVFC